MNTSLLHFGFLTLAIAFLPAVVKADNQPAPEQLTSFSQIKINGHYIFKYQQGEHISITMASKGFPLANIVTKVENNTLVVYEKNQAPDHYFSIVVVAPTLNAVFLAGNYQAFIEKPHAKQLTLITQGNGSVNVKTITAN